jgi:hypothetical protein
MNPKGRRIMKQRSQWAKCNVEAAATTSDVFVLLHEFVSKESLSVFENDTVIPMLGTPKEPIGVLKNDRFLLNESSIRNQAEIWAAA